MAVGRCICLGAGGECSAGVRLPSLSVFSSPEQLILLGFFFFLILDDLQALSFSSASKSLKIILFYTAHN